MRTTPEYAMVAIPRSQLQQGDLILSKDPMGANHFMPPIFEIEDDGERVVDYNGNVYYVEVDPVHVARIVGDD